MRIAAAAAGVVISSILLLIQPASAQSRVALVIGNGTYEKVPELPNPPRDAADIGRALERLNFKVTQIKNATAQEMRKAVIDFGRAAEGSEMAVVFYAGHGMEVGGENWLIPIGAELRSDADIESEAVSLRSVSLQVSKARQLGLVILDACRNNPFAAKMKRSLATRAVARGLAPTEPSDNVLIAYAARDGTTARDGDGRNSPFTTALLKHIETPGLEISFLFRRVRDDVMSATRREQQPFVYGSLSKDEIYLRAPAVSAQTPSAAATAAPTETKTAAASPATVSPRPEDSANKGGDNSGTKTSGRNVFTPEDGRQVAATGAAQKLDLPVFAIAPISDGPLGVNSKFVGVWSSKRGWDGKGRYAMVIITEVSDTGLARGYYLWGPPVKESWTRDAAGFKWFSEYIVNDKFTIKTSPAIAVKLDKNVLALSTTRPDKPSEKSAIELRPIWQLVRAREDAEPTPKREQASRQEGSKRQAPAVSSQPSAVSGSTMEDRYRACKKLVKGFAQREACARNGSI